MCWSSTVCHHPTSLPAHLPTHLPSAHLPTSPSLLPPSFFSGLNRVVANTREVCLTTHADPRCLASCIAVTTAVRPLHIPAQPVVTLLCTCALQISLMLQGAHDPCSEEGLAALTEAALQVRTSQSLSLSFIHSSLLSPPSPPSLQPLSKPKVFWSMMIRKKS